MMSGLDDLQVPFVRIPITPITPMTPIAASEIPAEQISALAAAGIEVLVERPHHPYSPSSLQSLEVCPMYKSRQSDKPHVRTIAGTKAHNSADKEVDDETLSDEDAAAVAECLDYVADLKQMLLKDAGPERAGMVQEINEPYLPIDDEKFDDCDATTAGYADKILISYDELYIHLVDYKFGMWPVTDAEENLQGLAYALGCFKRWPKCKWVKIHFLQPHLDWKTSAVISRADIPKHYFRICTVVARAREARRAGDYATAAPHVPICSFCANLGVCPKVLGPALQVGQKFYPLEIPADITPTQVLDPHNTDLAMRLAMIVGTWAKSFRTVITDRVIRGDAEVPNGFKLVSQSRRELVDMEAYRKAAIKVITAKEFASTLQTTFGAVEELIAEKAPRGLKKKVVETFQEETEKSGCVVRGAPITFLKAVPKPKDEKTT